MIVAVPLLVLLATGLVLLGVLGPAAEHTDAHVFWWLIVLAERMEIDAEEALEAFLTRAEQQLKGSHVPTSPRRKKRKATGGKQR